MANSPILILSQPPCVDGALGRVLFELRLVSVEFNLLTQLPCVAGARDPLRRVSHFIRLS